MSLDNSRSQWGRGHQYRPPVRSPFIDWEQQTELQVMAEAAKLTRRDFLAFLEYECDVEVGQLRDILRADFRRVKKRLQERYGV